MRKKEENYWIKINSDFPTLQSICNIISPHFTYFCHQMSLKKKFARESFTIMNELVLPNDTNTLNNLMGGRLLHWMDIAAGNFGSKTL
ncbi:hypothetical protein QFZ20_000152 [Flavobacterium sp. W4I14]|nr:hypothetical protein [Flavobacterium sp. W4I14]